jgi:putative addiction module component (TIGR02574 family)
MSSKEIVAAAMKLPKKTRARIAEQLWHSVNGMSQSEVDAAWAEEAERRIDDLDSGKVKAKPLSVVMSQLRRRRRNAG